MMFKATIITIFFVTIFIFTTLFLSHGIPIAEEHSEFVLLNVHWSESGINLNSFKVVRAILSGQDKLFSSNDFKIPRILHYDYFNEITGQMEGSLIKRDEVDFIIRVPWSSHAEEIKFYKRDTLNRYTIDFIGTLSPDHIEASPIFFESTQYPVEKIVDNGKDDNRMVMVVMGDGYTQDQLDDFHEDATNMVATFFSTSPWDTYSHYINVYMIDVVSNESGADHPSQDVYVDTALDASYNKHGSGYLLRVNEAKAFEIASLVPSFDLVTVIVNDKKIGASAGTLIAMSNYKKSGEVVLHEIGHLFADLADEYEGSYPGLPKGDEEPNVTFQTDLEYIPWKVWIEPDTPLPTPEDHDYWGVGLYEGAKYHANGIYRPKQICMMRAVGHPYCEICREALVLNLYNYVEPIDNYRPSTSKVFFTLTESLNFSIELINPSIDTLSISWELDETALEEEAYATLSLNGSTLGEEMHTLKVSVIDQTPMVRSDSYKALSSSHSWTLVRTTEAGDVSGMVKDASKDVPIEGALISIGEGTYSTFSQEDGSFILFEVKEGTYTLTASAEGYLESYQDNIKVVNGDTTLVDLYLEPAPPTYFISGQVKGNTKEDVTIILSGDISSVTTTGPDGIYSFSELEYGKYTVSPQLAGYSFSPSTQTITLDGNYTGIDFDVTEQTCPTTMILYGDNHSLDLIRKFRDEILNSSNKGKTYNELYYKHSVEILNILLSHSDLLFQTTELWEKLITAIESSLDDGEIIIFQDILEEIESLLDGFETKASPKLKTTIRKVRKDINRGEIFGQLDITIIE